MKTKNENINQTGLKFDFFIFFLLNLIYVEIIVVC